MKDFLRYWGKAAFDQGGHHLLPYHSLDVAAVANQLLDLNDALLDRIAYLSGLGRDEAKMWIVFFVALHDLGKFASTFQGLRPDIVRLLGNTIADTEYTTRHDSLGYALWNIRIMPMLANDGLIEVSRRQSSVATYWASAVTGHHGEPPLDLQALGRDFAKADQDAAEQFVNELSGLLLQGGSRLSLNREAAIWSSWWLSGLTVLSDWLGSNTDYFRYRADHVELSDYWRDANSVARTAITENGLIPAKVASIRSSAELFGWDGGMLTPLQEACRKLDIGKGGPQLFVLEDVTGAGKTEASLILANRLLAAGQASGVYFALPTMATANAMYARLARIYRSLFDADSQPSIVLAHGARHLSDEFRETFSSSARNTGGMNRDGTLSAEAHCSAWLADNKKKALLAEIGVGTVDQALLATLPSRHHSLRMLGLLGKVLIVDEVHACDPYMNSLLANVLKAHAKSGGSAILLSASLPARQRAELFSAYGCAIDSDQRRSPGYPLISAYTPAGFEEVETSTRDSVRRRTETIYVSDLEEVWRVLGEAIDQGKAVCWIRNTVEDAQTAFTEVESRFPRIDCALFHARFAMGDRLDIEQAAVASFGPNSGPASRQRRILIATQVVEQSLDLDFDVIISDLAPIDSLIQRAGRLCRHTRDRSGGRVDGPDERGTPTMHVFGPRFTPSPSSDWYTSGLPKAGYVYPNHGQLWLTAKWLVEAGGFRMPEDARAMMTAVYESADYPEALLDQVASAEGQASASRGLGKFNVLNLDAGYMRNNENFRDESRSPTRLGEETITVYLARMDGEAVRPWSLAADRPWDYSTVQIRTYYVDRTLDDHAKYLEQLPNSGKFGALVPLRLEAEGHWSGEVRGQNEKSSVAVYSKTLGLRFV